MPHHCSWPHLAAVALLLSALLAFAAPATLHAQNGNQIFNFILDQANREITRQQQRKLDRQLQQQNQVLQQQFLAAWNDCFGSDNVARCDQALEFPYLNDQDRGRLLARRSNIIDAQQAASAAAEAQELAREVEQAKEQDEAAERARLAREAEEQRISELRQYGSELEGCRSFNVQSCDAAYRSALATEGDKANIAKWRAIAVRYASDHLSCKTGSVPACDAALTSPALDESERPTIEAWRVQASPLLRATAAVATFGVVVLDIARAVPAGAAALPASTQITATIAALLAMLLAIVTLRRRAPASSSPALKTSEPPTLPLPSTPRTEPDVAPADQRATLEPPTPPERQALPEPAVVDTPAALRALKLAASYLKDTEHANFSEPDPCRDARTTLALAAKQLDIAHRVDPNARYEVPDEGISCTQARLRARVLSQESLSWGMENIGKAIAIAERATVADPTFPAAFRILGMFHHENRNRGDALAALSRALELDPDDIETLKLHDRAENMGVSEIATYKATRAGVGVANAGIGVYNAGVRTYNVFVYLWNAFAFCWNVVTFPIRFMLKIFGIFDFIFGVKR